MYSGFCDILYVHLYTGIIKLFFVCPQETWNVDLDVKKTPNNFDITVLLENQI